MVTLCKPLRFKPQQSSLLRQVVKKSPEYCKRYYQFRFGPVAAKIFLRGLHAQARNWVQLVKIWQPLSYTFPQGRSIRRPHLLQPIWSLGAWSSKPLQTGLNSKLPHHYRSRIASFYLYIRHISKIVLHGTWRLGDKQHQISWGDNFTNGRIKILIDWRIDTDIKLSPHEIWYCLPNCH